MLHALLGTAHLFAAIVWIGGMFFAHWCLRPAAAALEPALRLTLMHATLRRFFAVVAWAAAIALVSGFAMLGFDPLPRAWPIDIVVMAVLGLVMSAVFVYVRSGPFRALGAAVAAADWPRAAAALATIRRLVVLNLVLGATIVVVVRLAAVA